MGYDWNGNRTDDPNKIAFYDYEKSSSSSSRDDRDDRSSSSNSGSNSSSSSRNNSSSSSSSGSNPVKEKKEQEMRDRGYEKTEGGGWAKKKYATGLEQGPVTFTGLAMLHGTPSKPEYVINND